MAVNLDNLDDIVKQMASMERAAELEVIREARKRLRATVRSYIPVFKKATPRRSGALAKSIKVKSRSRRGVSTVQMVWDLKASKPKPVKPSFEAFGVKVVKAAEKKKGKSLTNYSGVVNFKKGQSAEKFASDVFNRHKVEMDKQGLKDIKDSFEIMFKNHGVESE